MQTTGLTVGSLSEDAGRWLHCIARRLPSQAIIPCRAALRMVPEPEVQGCLPTPLWLQGVRGTKAREALWGPASRLWFTCSLRVGGQGAGGCGQGE